MPPTSKDRKPTAYWDYIRVEDLVKLQGGLETSDAGLSNDEVMFIVIHQIDELWMKLAIREIESARALFSAPHIEEDKIALAVRAFRRVINLFEHASSHFSLMETMTTRDYLSFRDKLSPASGFQSAQLREIEIMMGLPEAKRIPLGNEKDYRFALGGHDSPARQRVERRLAEPTTLKSAIENWIYRTPIYGTGPSDPNDVANVERFIDAYTKAHEQEVRNAERMATFDTHTEEQRAKLHERYSVEIARAQDYMRGKDLTDVTASERQRQVRMRAALLFIESYRELPLLAWPRDVIDTLVALEQAFVIFRQRHARMVERIIGKRTGTGGSAGVDYLDQTALRYRIFDELWATRTLLVRREALPEVENKAAYSLVAS